MNKDVKVIIGRILNDLRVELGDEFNRNFERQEIGRASCRERV